MNRLNNLSFLFCFLLIQTYSFAQNLEWIKGAKSNQNELFDEIKIDSQDNIIGIGSFAGEIIFNQFSLICRGSGDIFLTKYTPDGSLSWVLQFSSDEMAGDASIALDDEDNIYVTGGFVKNLYFENDTLQAPQTWNTFIAKLSTNGELIWLKSINASNVFSSCRNFGGSSLNKTNELIIVCDFFGEIELPNGVLINSNLSILSGLVLLSIDSEGNVNWQSIVPNARGRDVAIDNDNNILFTGEFVGTINFGLSSASSVSPENSDVFLGKMSRSGIPIWLKSFLKTGSNIFLNNTGVSITITSSNDIFLVGGFKGTINFDDKPLSGINTNEDPARADIFLAKLTSSGEVILAKRMGSDKHDFPTDIIIDNHNNLYITGSYSDKATFDSIDLINESLNPQIFIAVFDVDGNALKAITLAVQGISYGNSLSFDSQNKLT